MDSHSQHLECWVFYEGIASHFGIENSRDLRSFFRKAIKFVDVDKSLEIQAKNILSRFIKEFKIEEVKMREMVEFTILEEIEIQKEIQATL